MGWLRGADQSVLLPAFRQGRGCWEKVAGASQGRFVRVQVPYECTTLPGYLLVKRFGGTAGSADMATEGPGEHELNRTA